MNDWPAVPAVAQHATVRLDLVPVRRRVKRKVSPPDASMNRSSTRWSAISHSFFTLSRRFSGKYSFVCFTWLYINLPRHKWIDHIIVVAPADSVAKMEKILSPLVARHQKRFDCIPGSTSRHRSIREALTFITESRAKQSQAAQLPDIIIVHDGARPVVESDTLHQLVSNSFNFGAAGTACKLTSTVVSAKEVNSQLLQMGKALERSKYWASEMPQAFRYNLLCEAYSKVGEIAVFECLSIDQKISIL